MRGLGLDHARWRSAKRTNWVIAGASGILAAIFVFVLGTASGQSMRLGDNWRLITLQVTLGPVLEEVVISRQALRHADAPGPVRKWAASLPDWIDVGPFDAIELEAEFADS